MTLSLKTRYHHLILLIFICAGLNLPAQKINEDSLQKIISTTTYDTARIDALLALAGYQIKHKMQDSIGLLTLEKARLITSKNNYTAGIAQALLIQGSYYTSKNNWAQSIEAYNEMLRVSTTIKNDSLRNRLLMMGNNNLGGVYNFNGDFNNSLFYRLKALEIAEASTPDNYNNLGIIYLNIASDYRQLKIPVKALFYLDKTASFFTKLSSRLKMEYYYEYHENYLAADSTASAKQLLEKISNGIKEYDLSDFQKKDYALMLAKLNGNFSLYHEKNNTNALAYFSDYLTLAKELKQTSAITESLYRIGETHLAMKNISMAINFLQAAYDSSLSGNFKNLQLKTLLLLADAYTAGNNTGKANIYLQKAFTLKSDIYNEEEVKQLNFLEAKYQSEKKEKEIATLTLSNTEKELSVIKRNRWLLIGGIGALALLFILALLYRSSRQKTIIAEKEQTAQREQIKFLERQQQVVSLQSMVNGQETERTRIAKDLHDGLGGLFSTIKMHFSTLQHEVKELKTYPLFITSYEMVNTASEEVRRIAHNMMPEVLIKIGLIPAVQELCNSISAGKLLSVSMQSYGMEKRLNPSTEIMLYRIIQELLNNIIKHANATEVIIQFNCEGNQLNLAVEDNGCGFDILATTEKKQAGLASVKSRVNYLNGTLSIDSQKEIGTTVMMVFLLNEQ